MAFLHPPVTLTKQPMPSSAFTVTFERVVLLALGGVGTYLKMTKVPTLDAIFANGASTLKAQTVSPESAKNWGSILHGVIPPKHGLTNATVQSGRPYDEKSPYPSVYKILHQHNPNIKLASYAAWEPINIGIIEKSVPVDMYAPLTHESIFVRWWFKFKHLILNNPTYDTLVIKKACEYIRAKENKNCVLFMIQFVDVDKHGRGHGWGSAKHLKAIRNIDDNVAKIGKAMEDAGWTEDTLTVITTDHAGSESSHGDPSTQPIFLAFHGKGIKKGGKIEDGVYNMDASAIILNALGVGLPGNFDGTVPKVVDK